MSEETVCECRKCRPCDGEGETPVDWTQDNRGRDVRLNETIWIPCGYCGGSGKNPEDCAIHGAQYTTEAA